MKRLRSPVDAASEVDASPVEVISSLQAQETCVHLAGPSPWASGRAWHWGAARVVLSCCDESSSLVLPPLPLLLPVSRFGSGEHRRHSLQLASLRCVVGVAVGTPMAGSAPTGWGNRSAAFARGC